LRAASSHSALRHQFAAGQFDRGHFHFSDSGIPDDECGPDTPILYSYDLSGSFTGTTQRDGLVHFRSMVKGMDVYSNPLTGKSYTGPFTRNSHDVAVIDNGDGTSTIVVQTNGTESWYDGDGVKQLQFSGLYRDEFLVDNSGTPSDPSDDEFIEFVGNVKPAQHDPYVGRDFCEDFIEFTS